MNESSGLALFLVNLIGGIIVYVLVNLRGERRNEATKKAAAKDAKTKTDEAKSYADDLVKELNIKITRMENRIEELERDNEAKAAAIIQAQGERDAARAENAELQKTLQDERQTFASVGKRVEELEEEVARLKAQNSGAKEAVQQIIDMMREGIKAIIAELAPKPPPAVPVATPAPVPAPPAESPVEGSAMT